MTLVIENASENLANAIKGIVKLEKSARYHKAKSSQKEPSNELLKAVAQAKEMRQNPHLYKGYSNAKDMLQACLDE